MYNWRCGLMACLMFLYPGLSLASLSKNLWPVWQVNNPLSTQTIDHHQWAKFLDQYVQTTREGINRVNYASIRTEDKKRLNEYIQYLSSVKIDQYNRYEQLAYWINLYNALTVKTIIEYYPVKSIRDINISPGLFSVGPWNATMLVVNGQALNLDEIHNRIIRPIWNDQRTHYALCNGAIGAANLQKIPFIASKLDDQLNWAAQEYVNSLRGVQVIEGNLVVSKLYKWFIEDFGGDEQLIIKHLQFFAREPLKSQLRHVNTVDSYVYNWHLNASRLTT